MGHLQSLRIVAHVSALLSSLPILAISFPSAACFIFHQLCHFLSGKVDMWRCKVISFVRLPVKSSGGAVSRCGTPTEPNYHFTILWAAAGQPLQAHNSPILPLPLFVPWVPAAMFDNTAGPSISPESCWVCQTQWPRYGRRPTILIDHKLSIWWGPISVSAEQVQFRLSSRDLSHWRTKPSCSKPVWNAGFFPPLVFLFSSPKARYNSVVQWVPGRSHVSIHSFAVQWGIFSFSRHMFPKPSYQCQTMPWTILAAKENLQKMYWCRAMCHTPQGCWNNNFKTWELPCKCHGTFGQNLHWDCSMDLAEKGKHRERQNLILQKKFNELLFWADYTSSQLSH